MFHLMRISSVFPDDSFLHSLVLFMEKHCFNFQINIWIRTFDQLTKYIVIDHLPL